MLWKNKIVKSTPAQQLLMNIVHVPLEIKVKINLKQDLVKQTYKTSTWEAEARRLRIQCQP